MSAVKIALITHEVARVREQGLQVAKVDFLAGEIIMTDAEAQWAGKK